MVNNHPMTHPVFLDEDTCAEEMSLNGRAGDAPPAAGRGEGAVRDPPALRRRKSASGALVCYICTT